MFALNVSGRELKLVKDSVEVRREGGQILFLRPDISLDPAPFIELLGQDRPGETFQPEKGRFVIKSIPSDIGPLVAKRFHYHRTYRRKQRWLMGYSWQMAHGPQQFLRSLYATRLGHRLVEPVMALRRRTGMLRQESLLVTRRVEGISLKDFFLDSSNPLDAKLLLFQQGLRALKAMHDDGITFGDAQSRHQILDDTGRMWWLDFDKMAVCSSGFGRRDRDLRRFFSSTLLRINQSGIDFEKAFEEMREVLKRAYTLPALWERILFLEVRRRLKRMRKRPGFSRFSGAGPR